MESQGQQAGLGEGDQAPEVHLHLQGACPVRALAWRVAEGNKSWPHSASAGMEPSEGKRRKVGPETSTSSHSSTRAESGACSDSIDTS